MDDKFMAINEENERNLMWEEDREGLAAAKAKHIVHAQLNAVTFEDI